MNLKQKLTYMLIGSLFTLAGYFFASLSGSTLPTTHAQQNNKDVIDEIVCKQIKVVDDLGKPVVVIKKSSAGGGSISIQNLKGKEVLEITEITPRTFRIKNPANMNDLVYIGGGLFELSNLDGTRIVSLGMTLTNVQGGYIDVNSENGKNLVHIGNVKGRPNDGLINVYNHKGEWRSFSKD